MIHDITVVIPNYNGEKYLCNCLKALKERTSFSTDIIVVDNGSTDNSIKLAKAAYPEIQYVMLEKNYGFSKAVNEGIKQAKTAYVILLNNDTEVREGFVEELFYAISVQKKAFSVEAKMLSLSNPEKIDSAGTFYNGFGWARARGKGKDASGYQEACETFAACAGAAIYRKSLLERLGYFDENYFAYLEDIDVGYRARLSGYRNYYEPKAKVLHAGSGTSGSRYNSFKVRISARNNVYLIYKNMPLGQIVVNSPLLLAGFVVKMGFFLCKGYGKEYFEGLKEGFSMCREKEKLPFDLRKIRNYINIQMKLWKVKI